MKSTDDFFVITGGPGAGKSTLLDVLEGAGSARSLEAGRGIIQDQIAIDGMALPWREPSIFAELMLSWEMRSYHLGQQQPGRVFFDRGMPDVVGYLRLTELPVPPHVIRAAQMFRYNRRVFIAPPWPEIFKNDEERRQSLKEARRTFEVMVATYTEFGYELTEIPRASAVERARFVTEYIGLTT